MGYRVDYRPIKKIRRAEKRRSGLAAMTALWFLIFLLLTNGLWPRGAEVLQSVLIPGDPEITTAALKSLVEDLKAGEPLADAVESFCITVIQEAGNASD